MERLGFDPGVALAPAGDLLVGVTVAPLTRSLGAGSPVQAAIFRIAPGGRIARHAAAVPQLLAVLAGSGVVSGSEGSDEPVAAGEAVFWRRDEEHETSSASGLTALVLEGEGLEPFRGIPEPVEPA